MAEGSNPSLAPQLPEITYNRGRLRSVTLYGIPPETDSLSEDLEASGLIIHALEPRSPESPPESLIREDDSPIAPKTLADRDSGPSVLRGALKDILTDGMWQEAIGDLAWEEEVSDNALNGNREVHNYVESSVADKIAFDAAVVTNALEENRAADALGASEISRMIYLGFGIGGEEVSDNKRVPVLPEEKGLEDVKIQPDNAGLNELLEEVLEFGTHSSSETPSGIGLMEEELLALVPDDDLFLPDVKRAIEAVSEARQTAPHRAAKEEKQNDVPLARVHESSTIADQLKLVIALIDGGSAEKNVLQRTDLTPHDIKMGRLVLQPEIFIEKCGNRNVIFNLGNNKGLKGLPASFDPERKCMKIWVNARSIEEISLHAIVNYWFEDEIQTI